MKRVFFLLIVCGLVDATSAQTPSPQSAVTEVQVVTYVDLKPAQATSGYSLLVKQTRLEARDAGCRVARLIQEQGRPNHYMVVETWRRAVALDARNDSESYRRFRSELQPLLASPLDERVGRQIAP